MQTNPVVEQNKNIRWSVRAWNQSGRKGKGLILRQVVTKSSRRVQTTGKVNLVTPDADDF